MEAPIALLSKRPKFVLVALSTKFCSYRYRGITTATIDYMDVRTPLYGIQAPGQIPFFIFGQDDNR